MDDTLTVREAYVAMYAYLRTLHELTGSEELGALLGGMSLLEDGTPADPAVWDDWLRAVRQAKAGQVDLGLGLKRG
jgi:hypothetical protein